MRLRMCFLAAVSLSPAATAAAQDQPSGGDRQTAVPATREPAEDKAIVVTGRPQGERVSIDRRSYDIGRDVQSTTGSVADVLRNLPSVDVDFQGNVSLRGQGNVTILVDGKPSAQFQGAAGAQLLQQIPAGRYERVEVITNPSAAFTSDGSSGIINLITKRNRTPGLTGSVRGTADAEGRRNGGLSLGRGARKFTLSANASARRDAVASTTSERFDLADAGAAPEAGQQQTNDKFVIESWSADAGVSYNPDARSRLELSLRHSAYQADTRASEQLDRQEQGIASQQSVTSFAPLAHRDDEADLSIHRNFGDAESGLLINLSRQRVTDNGRRQSDETDPPPGLDAFEVRTSAAQLDRTDLKLDVTEASGRGGRLAFGFEGRIDGQLFVRGGGAGSSAAEAAQPDPSLADRFVVSQTILSSYATYERAMGRFDAQLGTRIEWTRLQFAGTASAPAERRYARILPSLHLAYDLGSDDKLRAALTKRIQRPDPAQLDPFRVFVDPRHVTAGNPALEPDDMISAEIGFEHRKGESSYLATLYYHDHRHSPASVIRDLGDGILLSTQENLAFARAIGVEFTANGRLAPKLSYRLSGNAYRQDFDEGAAPGGERRSATVLSGKASVDWQPGPRTLVQVNGTLIGKQLLPQGFIDPVLYVGLGLRHKFGRGLWGVVTIQDALATYRTHSVMEAAGLLDVTERRPAFRTVFIGFAYNFGGGKAREPGLEETLRAPN